jgi:transcriptional regulator with XRE-family HTH domain
LIHTKDTAYQIKFGKHLKKLREGMKYSQEELANISEVSLPQITRIERGTLNTTLGTINCLAKGLGVKTAALFDFENEQ